MDRWKELATVFRKILFKSEIKRKFEKSTEILQNFAFKNMFEIRAQQMWEQMKAFFKLFNEWYSDF